MGMCLNTLAAFDWNLVAAIKLALALAYIRHSAKPTDDPLPYVALEVKDQIADAVRLLVCPPPDVLDAETVDGGFDSWYVAVGEQRAGLGDECSRDVCHDARDSTPAGVATFWRDSEPFEQE